MRRQLKLAYQLVFRGEWASKIIIILLCSYAFTLFALGAMGYTYNYDDLCLRAYKNYLQDKSRIMFEGTSSIPISPEEVLIIEEDVGLDFISGCYGSIDVRNFVHANFFNGEKYDSSMNPTPEYREHLDWVEAHPSGVGSGVLVASTEAAYAANGNVLTAGRYPEAENEIAVSLITYETFRAGGYSYNFSNYKCDIWGLYSYDSDAEPNEREEIACYDDLLGKRVAFWENDSRRGEIREKPPQEVVIVGIVDSSGVKKWDYMKLMSQEDFENDKKDAGEIGSNLCVTAMYELELKEGAAAGDALAEAEVKYKSVATGENASKRASLTYDLTRNNDLVFAACVMEFGLVLRNSAYKGAASLNKTLARLNTISDYLNGDVYKAEFKTLVEKAIVLEDYE